MNPTNEDLEALKPEIKAAILAEVKRRAVERILAVSTDRINKFLGKVADDFAAEIAKEFPL